MNRLQTDLILLGLLKAGPKHGYEIKKTIGRDLGTITTCDLKSIYYPLRSLEKRELVVKTAGRAGKRPEKFVYRITRRGERVFEKLFAENFLTFLRPIFNIDISLFFLPLVKSGIARPLLRRRLRGMLKIRSWLQNHLDQAKQGGEKASRHLRAILDHQIELTEADIRFTEKLLRGPPLSSRR
jgi:DNA-binding PadR family transcriptional regulator